MNCESDVWMFHPDCLDKLFTSVFPCCYGIAIFNQMVTVESFVMFQFFDKLNKELQTDKATIHRVERSLESLYGKLLLCFVKPSALSSGALLDVDFISQHNIRDAKQVMIGSNATQQTPDEL